MQTCDCVTFLFCLLAENNTSLFCLLVCFILCECLVILLFGHWICMTKKVVVLWTVDKLSRNQLEEHISFSSPWVVKVCLIGKSYLVNQSAITEYFIHRKGLICSSHGRLRRPHRANNLDWLLFLCKVCSVILSNEVCLHSQNGVGCWSENWIACDAV